jgi:hypothetical protein
VKEQYALLTFTHESVCHIGGHTTHRGIENIGSLNAFLHHLTVMDWEALFEMGISHL